MIMKKYLMALGIMCLAGVANVEVVAPDVMIKSVAQDVMTIVKQDSGSKAENQKKILALVDAEVLPNFNFTHMTQLAMGRYWHQATPVQQKALVAEFRNMLVRTYTNAFTLYHDQQIEIKPLKLAATDTDIMVYSRIIKSGGQPTSVNYRMERMPDGWKVYDVVIEAVSLVTNYRSQFASTIQQSGVDGLIKELSGMNADKVQKAEAK